MCLNCISKILLESSLSCKYTQWLVNINAALWLQLWEDFIVVLEVLISLQKVSQCLLYLSETYRTAAGKGCYKENRTLSPIVFNFLCASIIISACLMLQHHPLCNSKGTGEAAWYLFVPVFSRRCWNKRNICHVFPLFCLIVTAIYPRADVIAIEGNGARPFA